MANLVIKVENLSKRYRLGLKEKQAETLTGQIINLIKSPWENLKKLRELNRFGLVDETVFWALKDVSFEVKEGEVLGIIGKNGAGKSTLLKILSQITEPTSGKIEIHGRVASLLEVGTGFHPELSGRENIYMNGTILGMTRKEIDSKLEQIIDFSGVEKFIDTPVKFYSSGMKVRLGFSVAAHLDPEVLIIDEVLAVGDYEFQKKCLGKMKSVSGSGRTVLFVSHNLEAVSSLCTRSILLEDGKNIFQGNSQAVVQRYLKNFSGLANLQKVWDENNAPGNYPIKVKSISISNTYNEGVPIGRDEDIEIITDFMLEEDGLSINLSLHLYSMTGECVFNVFSQIPPPKLNSGFHKSTCTIPGNLLNEGAFSVSMMFVRDTSIILFELEHILQFELIEKKRLETNWYGKIPGFIHPKVNFKIHE
ncbi:ABC transporter ATP-binding protein [Algoriphagus taiwanensis]|uniref:ABC transporter ATP-binding protein n=1 Tax=Algoriphagus taiwanensis TaxID=1445656 RepID=A0ABQ6Q9Q3_9BACT|nr:ABC transporter ATP-binding protein [Algoriphagus taiwanensis]